MARHRRLVRHEKPGKLDEIIAEARANRERRSVDYRDQALNMFPRICARCGREFEGKKLSELTVHHKDHNHDNNPSDGSNWELLCTYCHDMEHARYLDAEIYGEHGSEDEGEPARMFKPFACLKDLIDEPK